MLYNLMSGSEFFAHMGFSRTTAAMPPHESFTSLVVSLAWNFLMQKYFVYRSVAFDGYVERLFGRKD